MKKILGKKNIYVIISYVMLLGVLPITLFFSGFIGHKLNDHIENTMENSAELCAEIIERQYESDMLMLEGLAVRMATSFENDPVLAMERLVSTAERYGMKRIAFSFPDGSTLATDKCEMNLTGVDNFERALKGERLLTTVIQDVSDNTPVNIYSLPVYQNTTQEIIGVMSAVYQSEQFENLLAASSFDGEGYTYIIDSIGNVVINSHHSNAISNMNNLFDYMEQQKNTKASYLKSSLSSEGEGFIELKRNKADDLFTYYKKLNISDWYVFSVVPENVAEETKVVVMSSVMIYCIASVERSQKISRYTALLVLRYAVSVNFSLFFSSTPAYSNGDSASCPIRAANSRFGSTPSRYLITVVSPQPRSRANGFFPISYRCIIKISSSFVVFKTYPHLIFLIFLIFAKFVNIMDNYF